VSHSSELKTGIKMINYKLIADAAQAYPNYQQAFDAMSILPAPDTLKDLSPNLLKMWSAKFPSEFLKLHSGIDAISILAMSIIGSEKTPLFVSDTNIHLFIDALPISAEAIAGIYKEATKTNKLWPNLKVGHVQNAMQKRAEGTV
jgi:hypothetical protein